LKRRLFIALCSGFAELLAAPANRKKKRTAKPAAPAISARARAAALQSLQKQLQTSRVTYENAAALVPFFEQLYRKGRISILHYGDSHTAADEWTGNLRDLFQAKFGNGGAGFSHAGRPWNSYRRMDVRGFGSQNWYSDGLYSREGDGRYGLAGVSITTTRPGESVSLKAEGPVLQINYLQQPGGGSLELSDEDVPVDTISTDGDLAPGYYRREVKPGPHSYTLRTRDRAPVRLFGWVTGNPDGLTYETLGINGAQASMILNWDSAITASNIADRNPALIVLAYGTNEAGNPNLTMESYRDLLIEVIARFRKAAPAASILLVGPPDRFIRSKGKWIPYDAVDRIVTAEREAASTTGCAFLDLRAKLGGKGTMHQWVVAGLSQFDHVHFTAGGYRLIAEIMFRDFMDQYAVFLKAREQ
jgi:lysophospholipase L1-like esterase